MATLHLNNLQALNSLSFGWKLGKPKSKLPELQVWALSRSFWVMGALLAVKHLTVHILVIILVTHLCLWNNWSHVVLIGVWCFLSSSWLSMSYLLRLKIVLKLDFEGLLRSTWVWSIVTATNNRDQGIWHPLNIDLMGLNGINYNRVYY